VIVRLLILTQHQRVMDGRTDGQTDRRSDTSPVAMHAHSSIAVGNKNDFENLKARHTLGTKLNSTRSTLLKVDKVDRVALALYTLR